LAEGKVNQTAKQGTAAHSVATKRKTEPLRSVGPGPSNQPERRDRRVPSIN
jgi:hypothetical protein